MDANKLVDAFNQEEFKELRKAIWNRETKESEIEAETLCLNDYEKSLLKSGKKVKATMELRARVECSIHCAKIVIDWAEKEKEEDRILNNNKSFGLDGR